MSSSGSSNLFVIDLAYKVPLSAVEPLLEGHREFLKKQYSDGIFLVSGAKVPRTGGMIIAMAESLKAVEELITDDPFHQAQVADYRITEFVPSMSAEQLSFLEQI